jgi:hypothetical protein
VLSTDAIPADAVEDRRSGQEISDRRCPVVKTRSSSQVSRRDVLSVGAVMTGIGVASVAVPAEAFADDGKGPRELAAVGQIYRLQAAFHRAETSQDIDLMMSLWDSRATLTVLDDPKSPYAGFDWPARSAVRAGAGCSSR